MSRTAPAMPYGLRLSLHSPQPTRPSSVSTLTNVHGRQPPSQCSVSTFAIFMSALRPPCDGVHLLIRCPRDTTCLPGPSSTRNRSEPRYASFLYTSWRRRRFGAGGHSCTLVAPGPH